jgi:nickel/cobalt transporter (NicO) family protein
MRRLLFLFAFLFALLPTIAVAHPLGNFTVNTYSRLEVGREQVRIWYVLDMAEIAAFQEIAGRIDLDGDTLMSEAELSEYTPQLVEELRTNLVLSLDGLQLPLRPENPELSFPEGQGGLTTLRLQLFFVAEHAQPAGGSLNYRDENYADRLGWREIIARAAEGANIESSDVPSRDQSNELRSYPDDMLSNPLSLRSASLRFVPAAPGSAVPAMAEPAMATTQGDQIIDTLTGLMRAELTPLSLVIALLIAFALGALHALSPGHGKTIVGAYLVGSRGTSYHALLLGLTTTITHTIGVFALGLITLFVSQFILPEQLYPWLGLLSGLMVLLIGLALFYGRLRQFWAKPVAHDHSGLDPAEPHDHGFGTHSHAPATSMGGLIALGVSGGLIPCPSALILLLGAIALGRVGLGLLLIVAFSLGLASVLTAIGILLVYARRLFERLPVQGRLLRVLPVGSALVVTLAGVVITAQALVQTGLLRL